MAGSVLASGRRFMVYHHRWDSGRVAMFQNSPIVLFPVRKEIEYHGNTASVLLNILWILFGGLELAIVAFLNGILFCITIIGIPFGKQCFKLAQLALMPFGSEIQ